MSSVNLPFKNIGPAAAGYAPTPMMTSSCMHFMLLLTCLLDYKAILCPEKPVDALSELQIPRWVHGTRGGGGWERTSVHFRQVFARMLATPIRLQNS